MTPALYIVQEVIKMLHSKKISFRINSKLWDRFCEVSEIHSINKSDYLRRKIIEFLFEKLNERGDENDQTRICNRVRNSD